MTRLHRLLSLATALILPVAARAQHTITTVAGGGPNNSVPALTHAVGGPVAVAKDAAGNVYILDEGQSRVIKLDTTGKLTLFAGNGSSGFSGDSGPANQAQLNSPSAISMDSTGNLFIADSGNGVIREVPGPTPPIGKITGNIYTVAGTPSTNDFFGDNVPATSANLNHPHGVFVDIGGNIFIADSANHIIREVVGPTPPVGKVTGNIYTVAGTPTVAGFGGDGAAATTAKLNNPRGVFVDGSGNVFVADTNNCLVRKFVVAGNITSVAGTVPTPSTNPPSCGAAGDAGVALGAQLNLPKGVFVDGSNNLFVADFENHAIREVPSANITSYGISMTAGHIYTVAGQLGVYGWDGDGGPSTSALVAHPSNILLDGAHNLFIADYNSAEIREVPAAPTTSYGVNMPVGGNIYTIAGDNKLFWGGDGGPANQAELGFPAGVATDKSGNVFIADTASDVVREVTGGTIQTVAGVPDGDGFYADDGSAPFFSGPNDVAVDNAGNVFVADTQNCVVRKFTVGGNIVVVAGSVSPFNPNQPFSPSCGYGGDGGPATGALLNHPYGIAVDSQGNLFIADSDNHAVREFPAANSGAMLANHIYTVAGVPSAAGYDGEGLSATASHLNHPQGVFVDGFGNIFIADTNNHIVREVPAFTDHSMSAGKLYMVAGSTPQTPPVAGYSGDGGPAIGATLNHPWRVTVDVAGNLFIADSDNQIVREVTTDGKINTVAGTPTVSGFSGDSGAATSAQLHTPTGIAFDGSGNLLIADRDTARIRSVASLAGTNPGIRFAPSGLSFAVQTVGISSPSQSVAVINTGSAPTVNIAVIGANAGDFIPDKVSCSIATGNSCTINVTFKPTATGTRNGILTLTDGASGSPQQISLTGTGGVPTADLSGTSLAFSTTQLVGTTSAAQTVTLTNNGNVPLAVASIQVTGTNPGDFAENDTCGPSIPAGTNCTISVTFKPATVGAKNASVTITDNANAVPSSTQSIGLTGTGVAPAVSLDSTSLTFPVQLVGSTSTAQTVKLTNNGTADLSITSIAVSGTNSADFTQTNTCGTTVTAGSNCTISVKFTPGAKGNRIASIAITDSATGSPQTVGLSGNGGIPTATLSGAGLTFAAQLVGSPSPTQTITLTNNGNIALNITPGGISIGGANAGDFAQTNTCGSSVAAGANCTISVTFTPTVNGSRSASITITDDATPSTQSIGLTGTGGTPTADLSGATVTFATQLVGTPSAAQVVTLTNNGNIALGINGIAVSGANSSDFAQTNTCGSSVAAGANCTISVIFKPSVNGGRTASINIADNATPGTQTIALTGNGGVPAATLSAASLTFNSQVVGTASTGQTVTLTNNGTIALSVASIGVSGANSGDFAQTNTCGTSVAVGANCTIKVVFTPGANGARTASITITDNMTGGPQVIALSGTGVAAPPTVNTTSVAFTTQLVGNSSAAQTVTLTNSGASTLNITSIAIGGSNAGDFSQTNTCGTSVAAAAKCTISVTFTPTGSGNRTASITITDNAAGGSQTVNLSGLGMALSLAVASNGSSTQTIKAGQTATYNLQLSATGGTATDQVSVTITCTGAPSLSTCNPPASPVVVTTAAAAPFSVTVATTAGTMLVPGTQSEPKMQLPAMRTMPLVVLAMLLLTALLAGTQGRAGRTRTLRLVFSACLVILPMSAAAVLTGCASAGGGNSVGHTPGTPAGSYSLTVTATTGSKAQSMQLTLVVQ